MQIRRACATATRRYALTHSLLTSASLAPLHLGHATGQCAGARPAARNRAPLSRPRSWRKPSPCSSVMEVSRLQPRSHRIQLAEGRLIARDAECRATPMSTFLEIPEGPSRLPSRPYAGSPGVMARAWRELPVCKRCQAHPSGSGSLADSSQAQQGARIAQVPWKPLLWLLNFELAIFPTRCREKNVTRPAGDVRGPGRHRSNFSANCGGWGGRTLEVLACGGAGMKYRNKRSVAPSAS